MPKLKKTKQQKFKELQDKWYKKLEKSGFSDIEAGEDRLKSYSSVIFSYGNESSWRAKREYYQMAENFLTDYKFATTMEEIIWAYHANGISGHNIALLLGKAKIKKTNRTDVLIIIKRLRSSMYSMYVAQQREQSE